MTAPFVVSGSENCLRSSAVGLASLRPSASTLGGGFGFSGSGVRRCGSVRVQRRDLELDFLLFAISPHRQLDQSVRRRVGDEARQLAAAVDWLAVIGEDHITRLQLRLCRWARRIDRCDHRASAPVKSDRLGNVLGDRLNARADPTTLYFAIRPSTGRLVGRAEADGMAKPMPIEPPEGEKIAGVDPDHLAGEVEHRPTGVAAIDRARRSGENRHTGRNGYPAPWRR